MLAIFANNGNSLGTVVHSLLCVSLALSPIGDATALRTYAVAYASASTIVCIGLFE